MLTTNKQELFSRLGKLTSAYNNIDTIEELAHEMGKFLESITEIEYAGLYFYDFNEDRIKLYWAKGFAVQKIEQTESTDEDVEKKVMRRFTNHVFKSKKTLCINDLEKEASKYNVRSSRRNTLGSGMFLPVMEGKQSAGVIGLISPKNNRFSELEIEILTLVANTVGVFYTSLSNKSKRDKSTQEINFLSSIYREDPFPIIRLDFSGKLMYANSSGMDLLAHRGFNIGDNVKGIFRNALDAAIEREINFEAEYTTDTQVFSLVFVPIKENQYVNVYGKDITYRKSVEEELKKTSLIVKETDIGVVITDVNGFTEWVNNGFEKMTGYTLKEIKGKIPGEILQGPETNTETVHIIGEALKKRISIETEILNYRKNGEQYWVKLQIQPVFSSDGNLTNFISLQNDVTLSKELEKSLIESEKRTKLIIDNALDAIIGINQDGVIIGWNPSAENIFGWKQEEAIGKFLSEMIIPAEYKKAHIQGLKRYKETGIPKLLNKRIEIDARKHSGKIFPVELTIIPIHYKNEITFNAFIRDITELKKSQNLLESTSSQLKNLILNLHEGVLVEDVNRQIVMVNLEFCKLLNFDTSPEALIGLESSLTHEQAKGIFKDEQLFATRISKLVESRNRVIAEEIELKDGRIFARDYIPVLNGEEYLGGLWNYQDVTQQKSYERELKIAKSNADAANDAKSIFLARMSHEIRTPLSSIFGMAKLLEDTDLNNDQTKIVKILNISTTNLLRIVNEILDFSKIEADSLLLEKIIFNLKEFLLNIRDSFALTAEEKKLQFEVVFDEKVNRAFIGDHYKIQQVLYNLINNALKFTSEGKIKLTCKVLGESGKKAKIMFSVMDTGTGIDKKNIQSIFNIFKQEDESVSRKYGGTGLGLSISKQMVELLGGDLKVESEKEKGSLFSFVIELEHSDEQHLSDESPKKSLNKRLLKSKRILVVEDNEFTQYYATTILEKYNANVFLANNGQIALDMLKDHTFDLILMDLEMPVLDGYATINIIRSKLDLDIPIIAMTANVLKQFIQMALDAGSSDYILKPFLPDELILKIVSFLKLPIDDTYVNSSKIKNTGGKMNNHKNFHHLGTLSQALGHDKIQLKKLTGKFLKITPVYWQELIEAYKNEDMEKLNQISHKIKSSINLIAIDELKSAIEQINECARTGKNLEKLPKLIDYFNTAFQQLLQQLQKEYEKM